MAESIYKLCFPLINVNMIGMWNIMFVEELKGQFSEDFLSKFNERIEKFVHNILLEKTVRKILQKMGHKSMENYTNKKNNSEKTDSEEYDSYIVNDEIQNSQIESEMTEMICKENSQKNESPQVTDSELSRKGIAIFNAVIKLYHCLQIYKNCWITGNQSSLKAPIWMVRFYVNLLLLLYRITYKIFYCELI